MFTLFNVYDETKTKTNNNHLNICLYHFSYRYIGYSIQWNHRNIPVFRPDVECTNGIIHVIDHPFLIDSDIRVTAGSTKQYCNAYTITVMIFMMLITTKMLV